MKLTREIRELLANEPAGEEVNGLIQRAVTANLLKELGFEPHGGARPETMRLYEGSELYTLEFWFPENDPALGAIAGIKKIFKAKSGKKYILSAEIYDGYKPDKYPNHIVQKTALNGKVIDVHDISAPAFVGERFVKHTFTATQNRVEAAVYLEVVGPLEPWNWGYTSRSILRDLTLDAV